jgi:hypothetical protein
MRMYYVMTEAERDVTMTVRLTREERQMVKAIAELDGVSSSDAVRMSVRRAYAERFPDKKAKTRR